jgi:hypothetical protein
MASVSAGSAYATDVVAVQRVYYNQNYNFSCKRLSKLSCQLAMLIDFCRPMDGCHVDTANRIFDRRYSQTVPCTTSFHESVYLFRCSCWC